MAGTALGAILGGGSWTLILGVTLWALWFHYIGFTHNGLTDLEWDRKDPNKSHFPLVSGKIRERSALMLVTVGTLIGVVWGWLQAGWWNLPALFWIIWATLWGVSYNLTSKRSLLAPIFISASFSCLPLYGYYAAGSTIYHAFDVDGVWGMVTDIGFLLWAYTFMLMFFQIAVSGYLKELEQEDQPNLLRTLGAFVGKERLRVYAGGYGLFVILSRLGTIVVGAVILCTEIGLPLWEHGMMFFMLLTLMVLAATAIETCGGEWNRELRVQWMAIVEILVYWSLVVALLPLLGTLTALAFMLLPLVWFVAWNRILWGKRYISPKV